MAKNRNFKAVTIDLYYHEHSYDALRLAEIYKEINSEAKVVLGGFTATYFCTEILRDFQEVDIVIKVDAEEPLLSVIRNMCKQKMQNIDEIGIVSYWRNAHVYTYETCDHHHIPRHGS